MYVAQVPPTAWPPGEVGGRGGGGGGAIRPDWPLGHVYVLTPNEVEHLQAEHPQAEHAAVQVANVPPQTVPPDDGDGCDDVPDGSEP